MLRRTLFRLGGGHGHGHGHKPVKVWQPHPDDAAFHARNAQRQKAECVGPSGDWERNHFYATLFLGYCSLVIFYKWGWEWNAVPMKVTYHVDVPKDPRNASHGHHHDDDHGHSSHGHGSHH